MRRILVLHALMGSRAPRLGNGRTLIGPTALNVDAVEKKQVSNEDHAVY